MIIINLAREATRPYSGKCQYVVANQVLLTDRQVMPLLPCLVESPRTANWSTSFTFEGRTASSGRSISGWVAGARREVACYLVEGRGYQLSVDGAGTFAIKEDGSAIVLKSPDIDQANEETIIEALLGPVLSIALAAKGVFCLHASACLAGGRMFAFLGDSGSGKSTVAAYLAGLFDRWQRLADDVLPVTFEQNGVVALPRFPQLKLPAEEQVGLDIPERIPLGGVYLLEVPDGPFRPATIPLDRRTAAATLIRHTMATSLFDERLLGSHIDLCANIAAHTPVKRLIYPHDRESLPAIAQMLASSIGGTI